MSIFWEVCRWTGFACLATTFVIVGGALYTLAERHVERAAFKRDVKREIREMERQR